MFFKLLSHAWVLVTPWTVAPQDPLSMGFPRNTGVCCHFLLLGIPTQGSNPSLLHWQVYSLPLSHLGSPEKLNTRRIIKKKKKKNSVEIVEEIEGTISGSKRSLLLPWVSMRLTVALLSCSVIVHRGLATDSLALRIKWHHWSCSVYAPPNMIERQPLS